MAQLEFLLKRKELIKKDEEDMTVDRILNPDKYLSGQVTNEYKIYYSPCIIETDDMNPVLEDDAEHVALFDRHTGEIYVIKCKFSHYKYITEHLSGKIVRSINDFGIDETVIDKISQLNTIIDKL